MRAWLRHVARLVFIGSRWSPVLTPEGGFWRRYDSGRRRIEWFPMTAAQEREAMAWWATR